MIAKVSKAGVDRPFNIDAGFTSFKYVEISLIVLISDLVLSNFISQALRNDDITIYVQYFLYIYIVIEICSNFYLETIEISHKTKKV